MIGQKGVWGIKTVSKSIKKLNIKFNNIVNLKYLSTFCLQIAQSDMGTYMIMFIQMIKKVWHIFYHLLTIV